MLEEITNSEEARINRAKPGKDAIEVAPEIFKIPHKEMTPEIEKDYRKLRSDVAKGIYKSYEERRRKQVKVLPRALKWYADY